MRIIGGFLKSRKIILPKKINTRPTTDFAKEALFSLIEAKYTIENATVFDFFSGLGGITFEFISRGAKQVVAIDVDQNSRKFILDTAKEFGVSDKLKAVKADFFRVIKVFNQQADFIFVEEILSRNLLKENGLLIVEHPKSVDLSNLEGWQSTRNYGKIEFSLFHQP